MRRTSAAEEDESSHLGTAMSSGTDQSQQQQLTPRSNGSNQEDAPLAAMVAKVSNVFKGVRNAAMFGRDQRGEGASGFLNSALITNLAQHPHTEPLGPKYGSRCSSRLSLSPSSNRLRPQAGTCDSLARNLVQPASRSRPSQHPAHPISRVKSATPASLRRSSSYSSNHYLQEEMRAAREEVTALDQSVAAALSFREKSTKLLEEAHRALSRLEQAISIHEGPELILVACEVKVSARRGNTLVSMYGSYSALAKFMTLVSCPWGGAAACSASPDPETGNQRVHTSVRLAWVGPQAHSLMQGKQPQPYQMPSTQTWTCSATGQTIDLAVQHQARKKRRDNSTPMRSGHPNVPPPPLLDAVCRTHVLRSSQTHALLPCCPVPLTHSSKLTPPHPHNPAVPAPRPTHPDSRFRFLPTDDALLHPHQVRQGDHPPAVAAGPPDSSSTHPTGLHPNPPSTTNLQQQPGLPSAQQPALPQSLQQQQHSGSSSQQQVSLSQVVAVQHHHHAPVVGILLRDAMHDRVHAVAYIPDTMKHALGDQVGRPCALSGWWRRVAHEGLRLATVIPFLWPTLGSFELAAPRYKDPCSAVMSKQAVLAVCLWWSAGRIMEFYSEATQATTAFGAEKPSLIVTALVIDNGGNVWTGHQKGLIRMRKYCQWEYAAEDKCFSSAIRVMFLDCAGNVWIGDEEGRVKVMHYDEDTGRINLVASLKRSLTLYGKHRNSSMVDCPKAKWSGSSVGDTAKTAKWGGGPFSLVTTPSMTMNPSQFVHASSCSSSDLTSAQSTSSGQIPAVLGVASNSNTPAPTPTPTASMSASAYKEKDKPDGPVRCMFVREGRAWIAGGKGSGYLSLWDGETFEDMDSWDCGVFGAIHAMSCLRWDQSAPLTRINNSSASSGSVSVQTASLAHHCTGGELNAERSSLPRSTHFDRCPTAAPALHVVRAQTWRLLTGHENGQLLMWHPQHNKLSPLMRIGGSEHSSPVRGIMVYDPPGIIVTGHASGELRIFLQPYMDTAPGAASSLPASFGMLMPRKVTVRAHKSEITHMVGNCTTMVTASDVGTIRMWHAADFARELHLAGLMPLMSKRESSSSYGFTQHKGSASSGDFMSQRSIENGSPGLSQPERIHSYSDASQQATTPPPSSSPSRPGNYNHQTLSSNGTAEYITQVSPRILPGTAPPWGGRNDSPGVLAARSPQSDLTMFGGAPAAHHPAMTFPAMATQTIDASELNMKKLIGSGAYGKVWLAEWTNCAVAVKELLAFSGMASGEYDPREYAALFNEVQLLGSLSHPSVMRFLAVCVEPPMIVMQYYPHGSLYDLLKRARSGNPKAVKELSWQKRVEMLLDIASGMQYLHQKSPPVIHGDLRSPNLLLDMTIDRERPRFHVKIADFGLARMLGQHANAIAVSKTTNPRWSAPEVIRHSTIGTASDVYSFAIVMWEMLMWEAPYEDMMSVQVIFSTVAENSRPELPTDTSTLPGKPGPSLDSYLDLMRRCWAADPTSRPGFRKIVDALQVMREVESQAAKLDAARERSSVGRAPHANGTPPDPHPPQEADLLGLSVPEVVTYHPLPSATPAAASSPPRAATAGGSSQTDGGAGEPSATPTERAVGRSGQPPAPPGGGPSLAVASFDPWLAAPAQHQHQHQQQQTMPMPLDPFYRYGSNDVPQQAYPMVTPQPSQLQQQQQSASPFAAQQQGPRYHSSAPQVFTGLPHQLQPSASQHSRLAYQQAPFDSAWFSSAATPDADGPPKPSIAHASSQPALVTPSHQSVQPTSSKGYPAPQQHSSRFASQQSVTNSPFASQQQAPSAVAAPPQHQQQTSSSPFSAPPQQQPVQSSPFASQQPVQISPFAQQPVQSSPFAQQPVHLSPFAQQPVQSSPFAQRPVQTSPFAQQPVQSSPFAQTPVQTVKFVQQSPFAQQPVQTSPFAQQPAPDHSAAPSAQHNAPSPFSSQQQQQQQQAAPAATQPISPFSSAQQSQPARASPQPVPAQAHQPRGPAPSPFAAQQQTQQEGSLTVSSLLRLSRATPAQRASSRLGVCAGCGARSQPLRTASCTCPVRTAAQRACTQPFCTAAGPAPTQRHTLPTTAARPPAGPRQQAPSPFAAHQHAPSAVAAAEPAPTAQPPALHHQPPHEPTPHMGERPSPGQPERPSPTQYLRHDAPSLTNVHSQQQQQQAHGQGSPFANAPSRSAGSVTGSNSSIRLMTAKRPAPPPPNKAGQAPTGHPHPHPAAGQLAHSTSQTATTLTAATLAASHTAPTAARRPASPPPPTGSDAQAALPHSQTAPAPAPHHRQPAGHSSHPGQATAPAPATQVSPAATPAGDAAPGGDSPQPPELFRLSHAPTYPVEVPGGGTWLPLACTAPPVSPRWLTEPGSSKPTERVPSGNTTAVGCAGGSYQVTSDRSGAGRDSSDGEVVVVTPSPFSSASAGASVLLAAGVARNAPRPSTGGGLAPGVARLRGADDIASNVSLTSLLGDMPGYALAARESLCMLGSELVGQARVAGVSQE
ncbi:MAG: hypothetical protein WDW38_009279 [Sanguina aurantia]